MFENITDADIVGVVSGASTSRAKITNRPSHTFIYKVNGESIYYLRGKEVHLTAGTVLYVPEKECYSFEKISDGESIYRLVNFHTSAYGIPPRLFTASVGEDISAVFKQMEKKWRFGGETAESFEALSLFYHLLAVLERAENTEYVSESRKESISPAVDYLEKHIYDAGLKISTLSDICSMSQVTFRHVFNVRFGMTPKKYIIRQRMSRAKAILESGEYKNISEVAFSVGYEDPLYFSKHFKTFYGKPPTQL